MTEKIISFRRSIILFFRRPRVEKTVHLLGSILKYSFFVFILFLLYLPILIIAIQSFNDSRQTYSFSGFTFQWWTNVFVMMKNIFSFRLNDDLSVAIATSLIVAVLATLISTVFGTIIAIGIHSLTKKRRQAMVLLNQIPILNADIITGLSLMFIFKFVMDALDLPIFGLTSLIIAHVFFCMPYVIMSVLPKLSELDPNLYDAALDLGCKPAAGIIRVIVPAIRPGIFSGMLIAFTMSIDDFLISFFNTGDNGGLSALGSNNLSTYIYGSIGRRMAPEVYAYNTILSVGVFVLLAIIYIVSSIKKAQSERKRPLAPQI